MFSIKWILFCLKSVWNFKKIIYYMDTLCLKIMTAAKRLKFYFYNLNTYQGILWFLDIFGILVVKWIIHYWEVSLLYSDLRVNIEVLSTKNILIFIICLQSK